MRMSETDTNPTGQSAPNSQDSNADTTPKPSPTPTPSTLTKEQTPSTDSTTSRHAAVDEDKPANVSDEQAYLDKHASLKNLDGEGAPGDISGARFPTEAGYSHPADFSSVTGRDQVADSER